MKLESFQEEVDGQVKWSFGKLDVEPSSEHDARYIADNLRPADLAEVSASTGKPPVQIIVDGAAESNPCYTIRVRATGKPCGIFGTRYSEHTQSGIVWLLGTDDLTAHGTVFVRHSRIWLDKLHEKYRLLWNVIDARNKVHLNWLRWLGFDFVREIPNYGIEKRTFILFRKYKDD